MRGDYGKKDFENANTKATGGLAFPLLAFISGSATRLFMQAHKRKENEVLSALIIENEPTMNRR